MRADISQLFKSDNLNVDTLDIIKSPFIRRFENRNSNVQYIDGKSARFIDFLKNVGLTISDACKDYGRSRDSVDLRSFYCHIRDNFINLIRDTDYKEAILFSNSMDTRENFRALVVEISLNSNYDYRQVLN